MYRTHGGASGYIVLFESAPPHTHWTPRANVSAGWPAVGTASCDTHQQCTKQDPPACCKEPWMAESLGDESCLLRLLVAPMTM